MCSLLLIMMMMILVVVRSKRGKNKRCVLGLNLVHRLGRLLPKAFVGGVINNKLGK